MEKKYTLANENIQSSFIIVSNDKIFLLKNNLSLIEINDFVSIGVGSQVVTGVLAVDESNADIKTKLAKALRITSRVITGVGSPFIYINTKDEKFETVKE